MRVRNLLITGLLFTVLPFTIAACGQADPAPNEGSGETAEEGVQGSAVLDTYLKIRQLAAAGDIAGASQLTDNPDAYQAQMNLALERIGQEKFAQNMKNAALTSNIVDEKHADDFAMLIMNFSFKGNNEKVANFFRKSGEQYVEIVAPDDTIPCQLVRDFYEAKGDTQSAVKNCSEPPSS